MNAERSVYEFDLASEAGMRVGVIWNPDICKSLPM